jgi:hypothetical protein
MALAKWAAALAGVLEEAATSLSQNDIRKALCDALDDAIPPSSGQYAYICDVFGDDESGDVVYCTNGDCFKAPYELGTANGKRTGTIHTDQAIDVVPRTVYDEEADEGDEHAGMSEADRSEKFVERFPGSTAWKRPFSERFISKATRDAADSGSFAGKGKSFPILKAGDVMAAVRSIGRAGAGNYSGDVIKRNIIRIAKAKGFEKELPDAWKGGDAKEAADVDIAGDVIPLREGAVGQDGTAYLKLIAPGWGSSGYYSKELLKRDGPKVFPKGTKNFWNHQTAAEESARPEGDLRDLASTLTEDAHYEENGPAGAGLYAKAEVQPHFRQPVDSLAKHIGMSIRASGRAKEGKAEGKSGPIIEQFTRGISVDYVTTPGAGGKVLQLFEAARGSRPNPTNEGDIDMDEAALKRLIESAVGAATAPLMAEIKTLRERVSQPDRQASITALLEGVRIPATARALIVRNVLNDYPLTEAGVVDDKKLKERVEAELQVVGALLSETTGRPILLGVAAPANTQDPKLFEAQIKEHETSYQETLGDVADIFMDTNEETDPKLAAARRKRFTEGRAA